MGSIVALGRLGRLPEIVGPIMFFLSDAAGFTTGQALVSDGGMSLTDWYLKPEEIEAGANNVYVNERPPGEHET